MTQSSPRGTRISHIGIAVEALAKSVPFFRDVLDLPEVPLDDSDGASIVGFTAGEPLVELLEAGDPSSPIGKFLTNRGPGVHHMRLPPRGDPGPFAVVQCALEEFARGPPQVVLMNNRLGVAVRQIVLVA